MSEDTVFEKEFQPLLPSTIIKNFRKIIWFHGSVLEILKKWILLFDIRFNPLTTSAKSCSNLAEIFSTATFIYLKNIIFYV
jgi:hypothetical protein